MGVVMWALIGVVAVWGVAEAVEARADRVPRDGTDRQTEQAVREGQGQQATESEHVAAESENVAAEPEPVAAPPASTGSDERGAAHRT
ncbi:MAG TPA: hypothetical protein VEA81_12845 [Burkholderiaceae bacterium]|nr:hypothetical protein [Burkholderiaceae bacterium]